MSPGVAILVHIGFHTLALADSGRLAFKKILVLALKRVKLDGTYVDYVDHFAQQYLIVQVDNPRRYSRTLCYMGRTPCVSSPYGTGS